LELLKEIKGFIYKFDNENYPAQSIVEAMDKLHHLYQGKDMTSSQFLEWFKSMVAVIEQYGGSVGKHPKMDRQELVDSTNAPYNPITVYSAISIKAAEKAAKERVLSCMFLNRADKTKYGEMVTDLHNDYVKGNDSYPSTLKDSCALLTNWHPKFESKPVVAQYGTSFAQEVAKTSGGVTCWGCGKEGIVMSERTNEVCIKKWKAKQERKVTENIVGQQHLNVGSDTVFEFNDTEEFSLNEYIGFSF
jgi:hypothetical protein